MLSYAVLYNFYTNRLSQRVSPSTSPTAYYIITQPPKLQKVYKLGRTEYKFIIQLLTLNIQYSYNVQKLNFTKTYLK